MRSFPSHSPALAAARRKCYPWATCLALYLIAIFPILTGMDLESVVSLVMIPTMLINVYRNLACITLPKKYPEQWEKRSLKMPLWFWDVCCVLGAFCAIIVPATCLLT